MCIQLKMGDPPIVPRPIRILGQDYYRARKLFIKRKSYLQAFFQGTKQELTHSALGLRAIEKNSKQLVRHVFPSAQGGTIRMGNLYLGYHSQLVAELDYWPLYHGVDENDGLYLPIIIPEFDIQLFGDVCDVASESFIIPSPAIYKDYFKTTKESRKTYQKIFEAISKNYEGE